MSDHDRSAFGNDDPNRGPLDRTANALDGRDDPNRGPLDRAENALHGQDDPNRGPLDRAANAITGGSGGVSAAMGHDDPNRGPLDRAANTMTGHDDPNRGPLDRTANAMSGQDDPNRGPLDRAANALTGGTGGVSAAMGHDDPNRGPVDRTENAFIGSGAGAATTGAYASNTEGTARSGANMSGGVVSALFDTQAEAEQAVSDLRAAGVRDDSLSIIAQDRGTTTTRSGDGEVVSSEHSSFLRGLLGGGALGAGLGVAALAIPGVGPLIGLGAIAASAIPTSMAAGAAFGAAAGTWNEMLAKHGVSEEDAAYYGEGMKTGGTLLTVHDAGTNGANVRDILFRNGGHTASQARSATM